MPRRKLRPPITILSACALIGLIFLLSGLLVRSYVEHAFASTIQTRTLRLLADRALRDLLDEETGIRGYTTVHDELFLQPYFTGRSDIRGTLDHLIVGLRAIKLSDATRSAQQAESVHLLWEKNADILRSHPKRTFVQYDGKDLVDRYRTLILEVEAALDKRDGNVDREIHNVLNGINAVALALTALIVVISFFLIRQQRRAIERFEVERARVEDHRRVNAELRSAYETEKRIANLLQDAITPRPLPALPTLSFSATYVPAVEEAKVGGDWYDALELPNQRVLFAIGDVAGHGIEAAVTMSRARQALASAALFGSDPGVVLSRVNQDLLRQGAPMVTAIVGYADPNTYEFVLAMAGHPPPVLIEPNRPPRMLDCGGMPLGVSAKAKYVPQRIQSIPGAMLILYTDGVVEHSRNVLEGEKLLLNAAQRVVENPELDPAKVIHGTIFEERSVSDDVAILTIGFRMGVRNGLMISADDMHGSFNASVVRASRSIGSSSVGVFRDWFLPLRRAS